MSATPLGYLHLARRVRVCTKRPRCRSLNTRKILFLASFFPFLFCPFLLRLVCSAEPPSQRRSLSTLIYLLYHLPPFLPPLFARSISVFLRLLLHLSQSNAYLTPCFAVLPVIASFLPPNGVQGYWLLLICIVV